MTLDGGLTHAGQSFTGYPVEEHENLSLANCILIIVW